MKVFVKSIDGSYGTYIFPYDLPITNVLNQYRAITLLSTDDQKEKTFVVNNILYIEQK